MSKDNNAEYGTSWRTRQSKVVGFTGSGVEVHYSISLAAVSHSPSQTILARYDPNPGSSAVFLHGLFHVLHAVPAY